MVIFRENTEDIYAGVEWEAGSEDADRLIAFLRDEMGVEKIRFPVNCGIGIKPVSYEGTPATGAQGSRTRKLPRIAIR